MVEVGRMHTRKKKISNKPKRQSLLKICTEGKIKKTNAVKHGSWFTAMYYINYHLYRYVREDAILFESIKNRVYNVLMRE